MSNINDQTSSAGLSRRGALRGAAWTAGAVTVVVATPNIAAATVAPECTVTGTKTGQVYTATISCGSSTITSVLIAGQTATGSNGVYSATLTGNGPTRVVTVTTNLGTTQYTVTFTTV